MTSRQKLLGIGIICGAIVGVSSIKFYRDIQNDKFLAEKNRIIYETVATGYATSKGTISKLAKSSAEEFIIDNTSYSKSDIQQVIKELKETHEHTKHSEEGEFIITYMQADFTKGTAHINVVHSNTQDFYKKVLIQKRDIENRELLKNANEGDTMKLRLIVTRDEHDNVVEAVLDKIFE